MGYVSFGYSMGGYCPVSYGAGYSSLSYIADFLGAYRCYSGYSYPGFGNYNYAPRPVGTFFSYGSGGAGGVSFSWWNGLGCYYGFPSGYGYGGRDYDPNFYGTRNNNAQSTKSAAEEPAKTEDSSGTEESGSSRKAKKRKKDTEKPPEAKPEGDANPAESADTASPAAKPDETAKPADTSGEGTNPDAASPVPGEPPAISPLAPLPAPPPSGDSGDAGAADGEPGDAGRSREAADLFGPDAPPQSEPQSPEPSPQPDVNDIEPAPEPDEVPPPESPEIEPHEGGSEEDEGRLADTNIPNPGDVAAAVNRAIGADRPADVEPALPADEGRDESNKPASDIPVASDEQAEIAAPSGKPNIPADGEGTHLRSLGGAATVSSIVVPQPSGKSQSLELGGMTFSRVDEIRPSVGGTSTSHEFVVLKPESTLEEVEAELVRFTNESDPEEAWTYVEYEKDGEVHKVLFECGENEANKDVDHIYGYEEDLMRDGSKVLAMVEYHSHRLTKDGDRPIFKPMSEDDIRSSMKMSRYWFKDKKYDGILEHRVVTPYGVFNFVCEKSCARSEQFATYVERVANKYMGQHKARAGMTVTHSEYARTAAIPGKTKCTFRYFYPEMEEVIKQYIEYNREAEKLARLAVKHGGIENVPPEDQLSVSNDIKLKWAVFNASVMAARAAGARNDILNYFSGFVSAEAYKITDLLDKATNRVGLLGLLSEKV